MNRTDPTGHYEACDDGVCRGRGDQRHGVPIQHPRRKPGAPIRRPGSGRPWNPGRDWGSKQPQLPRGGGKAVYAPATTENGPLPPGDRSTFTTLYESLTDSFSGNWYDHQRVIRKFVSDLGGATEGVQAPEKVNNSWC